MSGIIEPLGILGAMDAFSHSSMSAHGAENIRHAELSSNRVYLNGRSVTGWVSAFGVRRDS